MRTRRWIRYAVASCGLILWLTVWVMSHHVAGRAGYATQREFRELRVVGGQIGYFNDGGLDRAAAGFRCRLEWVDDEANPLSDMNLAHLAVYLGGWGSGELGFAVDFWGSTRSIVTPIWIAGLFIVPLAVWAFVRQTPSESDNCASCGYDLRGCVRSHCPECGKPIGKRGVELGPEKGSRRV